MEIVTTIIGKTVGYLVFPLGRQVGYVIHYKRNQENLRSQFENLYAAKDRMVYMVEEVVREGKGVEEDVKIWLRDADNIIRKVEAFLEGEHRENSMCLYGICPDLISYHRRSRTSTKLVKMIEYLYRKRDFASVSYSVPVEEIFVTPSQDYMDFESRISILKKIMEEMKNPDTNLIGVYGFGGVGKTTLAKEVYRRATKEKLFDDAVIVLNVKSKQELEKIQKEIAEKLGMYVNEYQSMAVRANYLWRRIKDRKTLVILDDVLERIDLEAMGLLRLPPCKVLLISRERKVLFSDMRTQKDFQLQGLREEETWSLFKKNAGDDIVKDERIRKVATLIAKRCRGLPLLVVTVASALRGRNLEEWREALSSFKRFENNKMTKYEYRAIEWSYHQLDAEELKPLFLLCGFMGLSNYNLSVSDLFKYAMGLGLIKNVDSVEESRNVFRLLAKELKETEMLLDGYDNGTVRMHDDVRDAAVQIAFREQHALSLASADYLKVFPNAEFFKNCTAISLTCSSICRLEFEVLEFQELQMFHLQGEDGDDLFEIPDNLFRQMEKLKVLELNNLSVASLPSSLQFLRDLRTLCLHKCVLGDIARVGQLTNLEILSLAHSEVKFLPKALGQLTHLRMLDLSYCYGLEVISPNVILSLKRLEELRIASFHEWEDESAGISTNASLSELKQLSQLRTLEASIPTSSILPSELFSNIKLERYQICIGDAWLKDEPSTLNTLQLKLTTSTGLDQGLKMLLKRCENLYLDGREAVNNVIYQLDGEDLHQMKHLHLQNNVDLTHIVTQKVQLPNLVTLRVHQCDGLRFLLSSSMARSLAQLKHLEISSCQIMEEIVITRENNEDKIDNMFPKLKHLTLKRLPNLARFCTRASFGFPLLVELHLVDCTKLGAFVCDPLGTNTTIFKQTELRDSEDNFDIQFLFDEKVRFPSLKRLHIDNLSNLKTIWVNQLAPDSFLKLRDVYVSTCDNLVSIFAPSVMGRLNTLETLKITFCNSLQVVFLIGEINVEERHVMLTTWHCPNLDSVTIVMCPTLKKIFPASVAGGLQKLQKLVVSNCFELEEIVVLEEGVETIPKFEFPKVTSVSFVDLSKLKSFYPGMHISAWPLLKDLTVYGCDKVDIFAAEFSIIQEKYKLDRKLSLFLIEKGSSFPNLENLTMDPMEICCGPSPAEIFSNLKRIDLHRASSSNQAVFLQKLQSLEKIKVSCRYSTDMFAHEGNSSEEIHAVRTLPHVRGLSLYGMHKLKHLGTNSEAADQVFPNLEKLKVEDCDMLSNLESSAISFSRITTLKVIGCQGLEYLITYSVAKSLMQLRKLEVKSCKGMKEIVASSGVDVSGNEIAFKSLYYMAFEDLPSLQGFCRGNIIAKFSPSVTLVVTHCCIDMKVSPDGLLRIDSKVQQDEEGRRQKR